MVLLATTEAYIKHGHAVLWVQTHRHTQLREILKYLSILGMRIPALLNPTMNIAQPWGRREKEEKEETLELTEYLPK